MVIAANTSGGDKKKRQKKFLCGVPYGECVGSNTQLSSGLRKSGGKAHGSSVEAFKCYSRYLISQGYTQVGPREFSKGDGPILVLTKKIRYGSLLRGGKGSRYCPKGDIGTGGAIVSC